MSEELSTPQNESLYGLPLEISAPGTHKYEEVTQIATAGQARVARALDERLDMPVFLKIYDVIHPGGDKRPEAHQLAKLKHPNIVPVHDRFIANINGNPKEVSVTDFVEGSDMRSILDAVKKDMRRMDMGTRISIIKQVASAVDYANRQGVRHRDIKPSNVMVDHDYKAFLTDFGIANTVQTVKDGYTIGTPGYIPPEQLWGNPAPNDSEEWAVADLAYEILTGIPLINEIDKTINDEGKTEERDHKKLIANTKIDGLPKAAKERLKALFGDKANSIGAVLDKGLRKKVKDRYPNATEFVMALETASK